MFIAIMIFYIAWGIWVFRQGKGFIGDYFLRDTERELEKLKIELNKGVAVTVDGIEIYRDGAKTLQSIEIQKGRKIVIKVN